jgi:crossover junction endodeoxyribonuclease RusA
MIRQAVRLDFFVPGDPAPQGSKRYLGDGRMVESSKRVASWRADVRRAAEAAMTPRHEALWAVPVAVELDFYLSRPKSHFGTGRNAQKIKESAPNWPGRPDVDKLARAVLDALTGLVIADDSAVVELRASKSYGRRPGVNVLIEEMW